VSLDAAKVNAALRAARSPFAVRYALETESTNDDAAAHLADDGSLGAVFVAERQTRGRGRRGRTWLAPAGSALLVTAILPRPLPTNALWVVPFWTALCAADAIAALTGLNSALQWPNDLLLDGRKVCGILGLSRVSGELADVACGLGINVTRPAQLGDDFAAIDPPPAFLNDAPGAVGTVGREDLLLQLLRNYESAFEALQRPNEVARSWERRAGLDGTPYRILRDGSTEPFEALGRRLAADGSLIVEREGALVTVAQADARVLR
jgi:BirA family biotin operon repressor/biotin-[acetyl-CoA-carboxylase] ligase